MLYTYIYIFIFIDKDNENKKKKISYYLKISIYITIIAIVILYCGKHLYIYNNTLKDKSILECSKLSIDKSHMTSDLSFL